MISINQLNVTDINNRRMILCTQITAFFGDTDVCSVNVLSNLLKVTVIDLLACKSKTTEHHRIQCTTYNIIKIWFDNWESELVELGFTETIDRRTVILRCQLSDIINMDVTCLSLDDINGVRGGHPEAIF